MQKKIFIILEPIALSLLFIISNNRIIATTSLEENVFIKTIAEIFWWSVIIFLILWVESKNRIFGKLWYVWKKNWPLILFIGVALLSIAWTKNLPATTYKALVLIASSFVAAYMGIFVGIDRFMKGLAWFFGIVAIICLFVSLLLPDYGIQPEPYHLGAWRGIFNHKNFMGSFMAIGNLLFLFSLVLNIKHLKKFLIYTIFYLLTFSLVILSNCATAMITLTIIHFVFVCVLIWLKVKHHLNLHHYLFITLFLAISIALALFNLDFLFGLFNRNTSLTGRIPLWSFLINLGQTNNPITGFGFGATWDHDNFRALVAQSMGYFLLNSDNGYIEIFLHLGWLGVIPFISIIVLTIWRTVHLTIHTQTLISFFPILITISVLLINITLSYFLEIESFMWILMIFSLFAATPPFGGKQYNPHVV